jgi:hypothetical protein
MAKGAEMIITAAKVREARKLASLILPAFFVVLSGLPSSSETAYSSGKTLLGLCSSDRDTPSWALCSAYIMGFLDGATTAGLCLPSQLTGQEAISSIVGASKSVSAKTLDKIKDADRKIALSSLLAIAYPCESKK